MNFQERKHYILKVLREKPSIGVKELSEYLAISEITVRRDLNLLAEKGLIFRTHGGAMDIKLSQDPIGFKAKRDVNQVQKEFIASIAAKFIVDGDVIFLDCGSTVFSLVPYIRNKTITVITNSIPLAYALINSSVKINFVGGEIDQERQAAHGSMASYHISRYSAGKAFIGVDGVSIHKGLSAPSEKEAEISLSMMEHARHVYLLCDSSKLEIDKYLNFGSLSLVHTMITDDKASQELLAKYRKTGLEVINRKK
jgi:DeoR family transcriptional regulator, fructose operon transcriptional repressor